MRGRLNAILFFCAATLVSPGLAETRSLKIEPAHTTLQFEVRHYLGKVTGYFRDVRGTLRIDSSHPENASVEASCPTQTVDTANHTRDAHLRSELFEVDKFPIASFRSTKVVRSGEKEADIIGDLTLHGVTRPIVFHVTLVGGTSNSQAEEIRHWHATTSFNRRGFGLMWSSGVEAVSGIGDQITLNIDCETAARD